jgi:hypothetical protein
MGCAYNIRLYWPFIFNATEYGYQFRFDLPAGRNDELGAPKDLGNFERSTIGYISLT